jgi:prepilin-type N-terminal cleavage/methylation domain-containing protein
MSKSSSRAFRAPVRRSGFTLIEILTVIAIIGILAGVLLSVIQGAREKANKATTQAMYSQWAIAIGQYKSTYGFYPNLGAGYSVNEDTYYNLDQGEVGENFVRALSGKSMDGSDLSDSERKSLNRKRQTFCEFPNSYYLESNPKKKKLADYTKNTKIRILLDTDRQTGIVLRELPENPKTLGLQEGNRLNAKIFIYTLKSDGTECEDVWLAQ